MDFQLFFITSAVLLFFDSIYLYLVKEYFINQIIRIQRVTIQPNYLSAVLCYILLAFALYYFILLEKRPITDAFLLGFCIYGIFETTNWAILKKWKWQTVVMDTLWGATLFALTTFIVRRFLHR